MEIWALDGVNGHMARQKLLQRIGLDGKNRWQKVAGSQAILNASKQSLDINSIFRKRTSEGLDGELGSFEGETLVVSSGPIVSSSSGFSEVLNGLFPPSSAPSAALFVSDDTIN